eukprot:701936-Amorphochlora_amoeboformis.AAC.1
MAQCPKLLASRRPLMRSPLPPSCCPSPSLAPSFGLISILSVSSRSLLHVTCRAFSPGSNGRMRSAGQPHPLFLPPQTVSYTHLTLPTKRIV